MLRNLLRMHPNLAAPEETHFYRWPEPFGTPNFLRQLSGNKTLAEHRRIDGVSEQEFRGLIAKSLSRRDLYRNYMRLFISKNKPAAGRWFDKTPQNVYGAAMIASDFPRARFVHIVRNPLDVVLSLRAGKVMHVETVVGAANYWRESAAILRTLRSIRPERMLEFRYEDFLENPLQGVTKVLDFVEEPFDPSFMNGFKASQSSYDHASLLSEKDRAIIREACAPLAKVYGYEL